MSKQIFKVGDRVFDIRHGWGKVTNGADTILYPIGVQFEDDDSQEVILYTEDGKGHLGDNKPLLSFEEYGFNDRFTQERPVNYEDYIGKWGKFWDDRSKDYMISIFEKLRGDGFKPSISIEAYDNFEPLTEEQVKVLGLEND